MTAHIGLMTQSECAVHLGIKRQRVNEAEQRALVKIFTALRDDPEVEAAFREMVKASGSGRRNGKRMKVTTKGIDE